MTSIAEYFATFTLDTKGALKNLDKVDSEAKSLGKTFSGVGKNIQSSLESIRLPAFAAFGAGLVGSKKIINDASDLNESINAVNVVFGDASDAVLAFGKTAATEVGIANKDFNQLSVGLGALLKDTGISTDELSGMTVELTRRAADLASVHNTDVSLALSAINQAIRGETEAIRAYAADVTDASLESFLLSEGIDKSVRNLSQQEKKLYRVQLLLKQTSDVQGDFANTSGEVANQARIQNALLTDQSSQLGQSLLPLYNSLQRVTGGLLQSFAGLSDETKDNIVSVGLFATALSGAAFAASFIAPVFSKVFKGFQLVRSGIAGLLKVSGPLLIAFRGIFTRLLRIAGLTTPIGIAINAAVLLATIFKDEIFEGLKKVYDFLVNSLPNAIKKFSDKITNVFDSVKDFFKLDFGVNQEGEQSIPKSRAEELAQRRSAYQGKAGGIPRNRAEELAQRRGIGVIPPAQGSTSNTFNNDVNVNVNTTDPVLAGNKAAEKVKASIEMAPAG